MDIKKDAHFIKNGNIKIGKGMWSFAKLAGNGVLNGCNGTCGEHCKGCYNPENPMKSNCYVFKSYNQYGDNVINSHIVNTVAVRSDINKAFESLSGQLDRAKNKPEVIRIHTSGEIEKIDELINWNKLAKKYPQIKFYIYTKCFDIVEKFVDENKISKNFFINLSVWHENGIKTYNKLKDIANIRAYVYMDGFDYVGHGLYINCMCPAYKKNAKGRTYLDHSLTCDKCKICFQNKGKACGCLDH